MANKSQPQSSLLGGVKRFVKHFGFARSCPCCGAMLRKFAPFGNPSRAEAQCPSCESLERHRLITLYLREKTPLFDGTPRKLLHVAPQRQIAKLYESAPNLDYLSADLLDPRAMVKMDITDIQYPDDTFDIIHCSHVLEHVADDHQAMRELCRVLKPGGWALLQVPRGNVEQTFEDPSITSPEERMRLFGQHDHVRRYGKDYPDRLRNAGFSVTVDRFAYELSPRKVKRFGINPDSIYFCEKPEQ